MTLIMTLTLTTKCDAIRNRITMSQVVDLLKSTGMWEASVPLTLTLTLTLTSDVAASLWSNNLNV